MPPFFLSRCVLNMDQDHFYLVGPKSNPACLRKEDSVLSMLNQIVTTGNDDIKVCHSYSSFMKPLIIGPGAAK